MVALLSGWCIYGFHRVITWEYPLLGWRFSAIRLIAGFVTVFLLQPFVLGPTGLAFPYQLCIGTLASAIVTAIPRVRAA